MTRAQPTDDGGVALRPALDAGPAQVDEPPVSEEQARVASAIDPIVESAIASGKMPGCVVVVGRHDEILFEKAYGSRSLKPERSPMKLDTVFDLASLTKPTATATSVMILAERGKIDLDARASTYIPELAALPPFTVRQLLVHTSGLPAGTPMSDWSTDRAHVLRRIAALKLRSQPGEQFSYSDVGFVVLQEIVERTSGRPLASFAAEEIFAPLGMTETGYLPKDELRARAAPTEQRDGGFMQGEVHDPRAFALGGVAGHAGVFSTARDMSRFAETMLAHGVVKPPQPRGLGIAPVTAHANASLFGEKTFASMITRHETSKGGRALGWDVDSTYATHKSPLLSHAAFGHGGYTGTALWIDPERDLFVLFLSNRVHPDGKGVVNPTVGELATAALDQLITKTGVDVLKAEGFERLRGANVGLITNASMKAIDGTSTIDVLRAAKELTLRTILTPEHGIGGDREGAIADSTYAGVPVRSLYGSRTSPTEDNLSGVDALVFDLQDVGVRFYTYASTMKRAMRVAADKKLRFVVLDRPNPIDGLDVQGPVLAPADAKNFVNHHALPLRHGMTMGELARLFAEDEGLRDLKLEVVSMSGWHRRDRFDHTGLVWSAPSPNLRQQQSVTLYPAIGLLESTNVSVGRGTDTPFEIVAAPWMDGEEVAKKLTARAASDGVYGVTFEKTEVTPKSSVHANKRCRGIRVRITDVDRFEPIRVAISIAIVLRETHPEWDFAAMDRMLRFEPAMNAIRASRPMADIEATWASDLAAFKEKRSRFLLYP